MSQLVQLLKIKVLHKFAVSSTVLQPVSTMFQAVSPTVFEAVIEEILQELSIYTP